MFRYERTKEGFARALHNVKSVAKLHPKNEYVLYVDSRTPNDYSITMKALFDANYVAPGTAAHVVDGDGKFTAL